VNEITSLARSALLVVGGFIASAVLQFVLVLIITHGLPLTRAGALFQTIALVMTAGNLALLGADAGLLRTIPRLRAAGAGRRLGRTTIIATAPVAAVATAVALGLSLSSHGIANLLVGHGERTTVAHLLVVMAWGIPLFAVTSVLLAGTRALGSVVPYVVVQQLMVPGLRPALVGAVIAADGAALAIAAGWLLPLAVGCVVAVFMMRAHLRRTHAGVPPTGAAPPFRPEFFAFWRYAAPAAAANVFAQSVASFDVVLVGALASTRDAAIYAAASRIILVGIYVVEALGKALGPRLSEALALRDVAHANELYHVSTAWMMAALWPVYATLVLFAPVVMRVFGHGYAAGGRSLAIIAAAELLDVATGNMTLLLLMAGRSGLNLANAAAAFAVNLGLDLVLIPRHGMLGAAVAWAACIVVQNLAALTETMLILGTRPFGAASAFVALATVMLYGLGGGLVRWLVGPTAGGLVAVAVGATACYAALLFARRDRLHLSDLVGALRPPAVQRAS
jgi:O-antigen/teichoic acid export membrane protein